MTHASALTSEQPMLSARDRIRDKARNVVMGYAASKGHWNPASSLTALLRQMQREYEDRFLYELIQNAYDAHPPEADGQISILLAEDEGDHGVLYVANGGDPFSPDDFKSICSLAQSTKAPDQAIGNKGVGFKSVLQVSSWPEVYSRSAADSAIFDGYCFTFARPVDYRALSDGDRDLEQALTRDVAPYFLPVAIDVPPSVEAFGSDGFATVIRLPLDSAAALETTVTRLERLTSESVPLHLFLPRLRRLEIARRTSDDRRVVMLTREAMAVDDPLADPDQRYEVVDLGAQGEWFLTHRRVGASAMAAAIRCSVDAKELDPTWADWSEDAWVSVAVRRDGHVIEPRMYTYLPMEAQAEAPLHGHLHAPFSTKLARTTVNESVTLNARLLDHAARATTAAVVTFAASEDVLPPTALVDLLAWDGVHHDRVTQTFADAGVDMHSARVVPIHRLPDGRARGGFDTAYTWPYDASLLRPGLLARDLQLELVDRSITDERLDRLAAYCQAFFGSGFEPDPDENIAGWVASAAAALLDRGASFQTWDRFYGDLATIFAEDAEALRGHAILLGADNELHAPPSDSQDLDQPLVFFPPSRVRTDGDETIEGDFDLEPPARLRSRLILLNEALRWNRQEGRRRSATAARQFLEGHKLVRRFDTVDLLEHTERALSASRSTALARDALGFAFRLYASARGGVREEDLRRLKLRVPCRDRWVPASQAFFSPAWQTSLAGEVAELVERGGQVSDDLAALGSRLIAGPDERPFSIKRMPRWRDFLFAIGVRDGLWPEEVAHGAESYEGHELEPRTLARKFNLPTDVEEQWVSSVRADPSYRAGHPYTRYRATTPVSVLPGQADYEQFDDRARSGWARLVVAGLEQWGATALDIAWSRYLPRHRNHPDVRRWPSPIQTFLAGCEWVPIAEPGDRRDEVFVRPCEAWYYSESSGDRPPQFSPLVTPWVRRRLSDSPGALEVAKRLGLGDWLDPDHSPRLLGHLASLLDENRLPDSGHWGLRGALQDAWSRATAWDGAAFAEAMKSTPLVATCAGLFRTFHPDSFPESGLYVASNRRSFATRVLEAGELPLVTVNDPDAEAVASLLRSLAGEQVRTAGSLDIEFVVDGQAFKPGASSARLVEGQPSWLPQLIQLVLEVKRARFDTSSARRRGEVLDTLNRIRIHRADTVLIKAGPVVVSPSGPHRDVVPIDDPAHPTLISIRGGGRESDPFATELVSLVPGLCELLGISDYEDTIGRPIEHLLSSGVKAPTPADLARALRLDLSRVGEVLSHLVAPIDGLITMIAPAVAYSAGVEAGLRLLDQRGAIEDEAGLVAAVGQIAPKGPAGHTILAAARESGSLGDLRDTLQLDFARFNAVLRDLGDEYHPIHNESGHVQALRHFVDRHHEDLLLRLRRRFIAAYQAHKPLDDYANARELYALSPDPEWLDRYERPPEELLATHVDLWIDSFGEDPTDHTGALLPIGELRHANREIVVATATLANTLVPAWARKNHSPVPEVWEEDEPAASVTDEAVQSGQLDFEMLDRTSVIESMFRAGHWPPGMRRSLDLQELDLDKSDIEQEQDAEDRARNERARRRRLISVDGRDFSAERDGYATLASHVRSTMRPDLLRSGRTTARLAELPQVTPSSGARAGGGARRVVRPTRLSDQQTAAIGLVGETIAYEWLRDRYSHVCSPSAWKSSYSETIGQPAGDDTLGYDFEIALRTVTIYFEVKATAGTTTSFELGESEVGKARDSTRSHRFDYRILFLTEALDAERRQLFLLPNPMDPANQDLFRFPGSGLTCAFKLDV